MSMKGLRFVSLKLSGYNPVQLKSEADLQHPGVGPT